MGERLKKGRGKVKQKGGKGKKEAPADLLGPHVEEEVGGGEAEDDAVDVQGAGLGHQEHALDTRTRGWTHGHPKPAQEHQICSRGTKNHQMKGFEPKKGWEGRRELWNSNPKSFVPPGSRSGSRKRGISAQIPAGVCREGWGPPGNGFFWGEKQDFGVGTALSSLGRSGKEKGGCGYTKSWETSRSEGTSTSWEPALGGKKGENFGVKSGILGGKAPWERGIRGCFRGHLLVPSMMVLRQRRNTSEKGLRSWQL
ncbi:hypothetical protein DV515_00018903 [Chloebia gouldiae]|uniref:Uncharacterized protein n=1 Tax=Chloebia gouldiae TaxID=44316 RepID=A0A3L8Q685_CHLGU|nr:hypothetical protein DV515_00018903 [Chloebia gouldiae]